MLIMCAAGKGMAAAEAADGELLTERLRGEQLRG